ncbi:hypothetical protein ACFQL4_04210 [Halosimplex aquaticum]
MLAAALREDRPVAVDLGQAVDPAFVVLVAALVPLRREVLVGVVRRADVPLAALDGDALGLGEGEPPLFDGPALVGVGIEIALRERSRPVERLPGAQRRVRDERGGVPAVGEFVQDEQALDPSAHDEHVHVCGRVPPQSLADPLVQRHPGVELRLVRWHLLSPLFPRSTYA